MGGVNDDYLAETMVNSFQNAGGLSLATFIPHVTRIARLMDLRFTSHSSVRENLVYVKSPKTNKGSFSAPNPNDADNIYP